MGDRATLGRRALRLVPVGLLFVGIVAHAARIELANEDPQSGSAFAMFATVDVTATRRIVATGPESIPLELPTDLAGQATRLADTPSDEGARRLADELLSRTWDLREDAALPAGDTTLDQIHVAVVGLDADGWTMTRTVLADATAR